LTDRKSVVLSRQQKPFPYSATTRRLQIVAVGLLVAAGCVNYLDRAAVAVAGPQIRADLHVSYGQMGFLLSAFAWSYGIAQIPAGMLVDRFGPRRTLGLGLILWSFAQLSATVVRSLGQFVAARVALGLGESPMYIGGTRVCADWFARDQRALPIAIFNSSSGLAPALAPPLLTWLMLAFGWRPMFLIAGLAGLAVAVLWGLLYRAPEEAGIPPDDIAEIHRDDAPGAEDVGLRHALWLLRFKSSWGMFLGFFGVVYVSWLYATWLPAYLEDARHQSAASAGFWAAIPLGAGFLGALSGGFISNGLTRLGIDPTTACRTPTAVGLLMAGIFTIAAAFSDQVIVAIALMGCGLFAANASSSCGWALPAVMVPPNSVATLEAVQNVGGSLGGALAPFVTGALVQRAHGSFTHAFVLAGLISIACGFVYQFMTREARASADEPGRPAVRSK
jgi:sugar phosphate permease